MFLYKLLKKNKRIFAGLLAVTTVAATIAATTLILGTETTHMQSAYAYARPKANPVANTANSNEDWITYCKQYTGAARECATGPSNNGEYTSYIAHLVNGP